MSVISFFDGLAIDVQLSSSGLPAIPIQNAAA
jgi:hypothetical protein